MTKLSPTDLALNALLDADKENRRRIVKAIREFTKDLKGSELQLFRARLGEFIREFRQSLKQQA